VRKAILTLRDEGSVTATATLPVKTARLCPHCGYGHFGPEPDCCAHCKEKIKDGLSFSNLYRIEQVSTRKATRITSDEEERQRQGYEMVTTLRYAEENGRVRRRTVAFQEDGESLLDVAYGPAATIWRINLGWRRRKEKNVYGFSIDVNTGEWTKDSQAPTDAEDDFVKQGKTVQRITPFVEDTKNVLLVRPQGILSESGLVTLQHALKRGIEQEFQLEESELAVEPLPDRERRNAFLFYEAAEGGAGVLTRLTSDPKAFSRVAQRALEICHYGTKGGTWKDSGDLENLETNCEAGCYRCLLSYYNQTDHPLIDRRNVEVLDFLCRLIRADYQEVQTVPSVSDSFEALLNASVSSLEKEWLVYLKDRHLRLPDRGHHTLREHDVNPDFEYLEDQVVVFIDGPAHDQPAQKEKDKEITSRLENAGYTVIRFGYEKAGWDKLLNDHAWVFGEGVKGGVTA
jgi:very-short-patch-repair endonuclease